MYNWTEAEMIERKRVGDAVLGAVSLSEVREARAAFLSWLERFPDDFGMRDVGSTLSHATDFANERERQRIAMKLTEEEGRERERVITQVFRIASLRDAKKANTDLTGWLERHEEDIPNSGEYYQAISREWTMYEEIEKDLAILEAKGAAFIDVNAASKTARKEPALSGR